MTQKSLQVHSENILPIIKKWLYSDKDIFVRELVSNAIDAIHKTKILRDKGETEATDEEFRIDIKIDKDKKTLTFTDTGVGMTAEEVEKYIAQVAFSSAEEFVEKYTSKEEKDQLIGHFGLGFYSAYMVAEKVEINTLSFKKDADPVAWTCDGSTTYEIGKGQKATRGTEIILHVSEEEKTFLDEFHIREILTRYCTFLPYPLYLNDQLINAKEPLWLKAPSECSDKDYLSFFHHLYPGEADPLFWIHLNVDYPFHLQGILYFPKLRRDPETVQKSNLSLYCNRVFVSDQCQDIVPDFLLGLRGVIDSPDIPLNVSRSHLQMDRTVRQLAGHISKKVADKLSTLYTSDKDRFISCWSDIQGIVKLGAMQEDKFYEKVKKILIWQTTNDEWTTVEDYLERNEKKTGEKVFYTSSGKESGKESGNAFLTLYKEQNIEVLRVYHHIDTFMFDFLERKISSAKFQRIDGGIDDSILDPTREKTLLDAEGHTPAGKIAKFMKESLRDHDVEVEAKSLAGDALPGFIVIEESERRMRDYMMTINPTKGAGEVGIPCKRTFVVNTNNKLISLIDTLNGKQPKLASALVDQLFNLSLLSQNEMTPEQLGNFVDKSSSVLEQLAAQAVDKDKG